MSDVPTLLIRCFVSMPRRGVITFHRMVTAWRQYHNGLMLWHQVRSLGLTLEGLIILLGMFGIPWCEVLDVRHSYCCGFLNKLFLCLCWPSWAVRELESQSVWTADKALEEHVPFSGNCIYPGHFPAYHMVKQQRWSRELNVYERHHWELKSLVKCMMNIWNTGVEFNGKNNRQVRDETSRMLWKKGKMFVKAKTRQEEVPAVYVKEGTFIIPHISGRRQMVAVPGCVTLSNLAGYRVL